MKWVFLSFLAVLTLGFLAYNEVSPSPQPQSTSDSTSERVSPGHAVERDGVIREVTPSRSGSLVTQGQPTSSPGDDTELPKVPDEDSPAAPYQWDQESALAAAKKLEAASAELQSNVLFMSARNFLSQLARNDLRDPEENIEGAFALFLNADYHLIPDQLLVGWVGILESGPGVELADQEREALLPLLLDCSREARDLDTRIVAQYGGDITRLTRQEQESFFLERRLEFESVYHKLMEENRRVLGHERFQSVAKYFERFGLIVN